MILTQVSGYTPMGVHACGFLPMGVHACGYVPIGVHAMVALCFREHILSIFMYFTGVCVRYGVRAYGGKCHGDPQR